MNQTIIKVSELYNELKGDINIQIKMQESIVKHLLDNNIEGDVLEIGAFIGNTTKMFSKALENNINKKIYVLDPYNGQQEGNDNVYSQFKQNTNELINLIHYREKSQSDFAINFMKKNRFMYVFVDGLHTYEGCFHDMLNIADNLSIGGVICLDDTNVIEIKKALSDFLLKNENFNLINKPRNIDSLGVYNPRHKGMDFIIKDR
jgi:predicted O-methyltransferase YrrM